MRWRRCWLDEGRRQNPRRPLQSFERFSRTQRGADQGGEFPGAAGEGAQDGGDIGLAIITKAGLGAPWQGVGGGVGDGAHHGEGNARADRRMGRLVRLHIDDPGAAGGPEGGLILS